MPTYRATIKTKRELEPYTHSQLTLRIESAVRSVLNDSIEDVKVYINQSPIEE